MKLLSLINLLLAPILLASPTKGAVPQEAVADWKTFVIKHPWPQYPFFAQEFRYSGEGRFRFEIDPETAGVNSITVLKSTGHKVLDDAAIVALRRWQFRPHVARAAIIPVAFERGKPLDKAQLLATYCVEPDFPVTWHRSSGVYRFIVDYETGDVTDVKIVKSTGLPKYDEAVVKAYRQWRFPPHKIRSIDTTVEVRP